jgi:hypothetical protein
MTSFTVEAGGAISMWRARCARGHYMSSNSRPNSRFPTKSIALHGRRTYYAARYRYTVHRKTI